MSNKSDEQPISFERDKYIKDEDEIVVDRTKHKDSLERPVFHPQRWRTQKRTAAQRERDLAEIAQLYLAGGSQREIMEVINANRDYNISRQMVGKDIKLIWERWKETYLRDFNELKMRELAKIDKLEAEYWEAWEDSCQDFMSVEKYEVNDKVAHGQKAASEEAELQDSYQRVRTTTKKEKRTGDPKYLEGIRKCINDRCKILGLHSAKKVDINWRTEARAAGINPDELEDNLVNEFIEAANRGAK
jgi:hypothetical protein